MAERIKGRIEQLRKDGKNEEADRMEKRVKEYAERMSSAHHEGQPKAPDKAPDQKREDARKEFMSMAERMKKHLVEELRHDGKNEEADKVEAMAKKFAENMAAHRNGQHGQPDGKGQQGPGPRGAKNGQANAEHGHHMHPPMMGAANGQAPQWGHSFGHHGGMPPWASQGAWGQRRGQGGPSDKGHGHHRGHGGQSHEERGHHRGHGHKGHGFGPQGGMNSRGGQGSWGQRGERGFGGHGDQRGHGFGHGQFGEHGQPGSMAPWGRGFGMHGGMPPQGGHQGRGFGKSHGMTPWGAPPPWAGQQQPKKDGPAPKGKGPDHKGGMPPQGGPPAWGGMIPHHQGGDAPRGDKTRPEGKNDDGTMDRNHKGDHHHGPKHEDNKEEIRPAGRAGAASESSVGEPPEV